MRLGGIQHGLLQAAPIFVRDRGQARSQIDRCSGSARAEIGDQTGDCLWRRADDSEIRRLRQTGHVPIGLYAGDHVAFQVDWQDWAVEAAAEEIAKHRRADALRPVRRADHGN